MMPMPYLKVIYSFLIATVVLVNGIHAADAPDEWKKVIEAAKKEGKIVAGGPPTAVLRKQFKETFENRFGIELELLSAQGAQNAQRAMSEFKAGVKYFDVLHGGSGTIEPLKYENMLAPFMDFVILPEVKDPKQWWGGHMWEDNVKTNRFIYSFSADFSVPPFYNTDFNQARRDYFFRRFFAAEMERQDRHVRAAHSERRSRALGLLDARQRKRVFAKARRAKSFYPS